jgi:hypothetical protein
VRWMAFAALGALAGCAPPVVRTTFLQSVDLVDMTDRMAQSFAGDTAIGGRGDQSPPWVISIDRVANFTNQIMPQREKWLYVTRLRSLLDRNDFCRARNIIWVVQPERWPMAAEEGVAAPRLSPTHLLAAEFQTLTNTSGTGRSDMYACSFQLSDLDSGRIVWEDLWEVKRAASGRTYD